METIQDIWAELGARLRRFIGKRVGDPHAADDITQDVMLKVQRQLGNLPPEDKLAPWVFRVARNAIIDHHRAGAIREHSDVADVATLAQKSTADQQEAVRELTPCLSKMVERLPEPYRETMRLADFEGLSQQQIADRAGISLSGAKSRVQRARLQLREMIEDCCRVELDGRGGVVSVETTPRTSHYCDDGAKDADCGG